MKHRTSNMNPDIGCRGGHRTSNVPDFLRLGVQCSMFDVRCFRNEPDHVGTRTALSAEFRQRKCSGTDARQVLADCQCPTKNWVQAPPALATIMLRLRLRHVCSLVKSSNRFESHRCRWPFVFGEIELSRINES